MISYAQLSNCTNLEILIVAVFSLRFISALLIFFPPDNINFDLLAQKLTNSKLLLFIHIQKIQNNLVILTSPCLSCRCWSSCVQCVALVGTTSQYSSPYVLNLYEIRYSGSVQCHNSITLLTNCGYDISRRLQKCTLQYNGLTCWMNTFDGSEGRQVGFK